MTVQMKINFLWILIWLMMLRKSLPYLLVLMPHLVKMLEKQMRKLKKHRIRMATRKHRIRMAMVPTMKNHQMQKLITVELQQLERETLVKPQLKVYERVQDYASIQSGSMPTSLESVSARQYQGNRYCLPNLYIVGTCYQLCSIQLCSIQLRSIQLCLNLFSFN